MNGVISGVKNTVGGTVVASARALKAVEPIQYSGIIMITSSASTSAMAPRFHQRERRDWTMAMVRIRAMLQRAFSRFRYLTYTLVMASTASSTMYASAQERPVCHSWKAIL